VSTDRAVDSRLELSVKKFDEDRIVTLLESVPELCRDDLISPAIAVFHLDVGLLGYRVQVLMHRLQQHRKHLLRIVLCKSLELDSLPCDPILDVPRRNIPRLAHPQVLQ